MGGPNQGPRADQIRDQSRAHRRPMSSVPPSLHLSLSLCLPVSLWFRLPVSFNLAVSLPPNLSLCPSVSQRGWQPMHPRAHLPPDAPDPRFFGPSPPRGSLFYRRGEAWERLARPTQRLGGSGPNRPTPETPRFEGKLSQRQRRAALAAKEGRPGHDDTQANGPTPEGLRGACRWRPCSRAT